METAPPPVAAPELPETPWVIQTVILRLVIWGSAAAGMILFWFVGQGFNIPAQHGFSASLLEGAPVSNVLIVTVIYLAVAGIINLVFGSFKPLIGVFAASFGLAAISMRGGMTTSLLRSVGGSGVYLSLLIETIILTAIVAIAAAATAFLSRRPPIEQIKEEEVDAPNLNMKLLSIGIQTGVTIIFAALLAQSDVKGQALAAAGIASLAGAMVADNAMPVGLTPLAILAPFIAGLIGYGWAIFAHGDMDPANNLVNILPLDYASFGVAGAMLGHWISQQWREEAEEE